MRIPTEEEVFYAKVSGMPADFGRIKGRDRKFFIEYLKEHKFIERREYVQQDWMTDLWVIIPFTYNLRKEKGIVEKEGTRVSKFIYSRYY